MGGEVGLDSEIGEGSTFWFTGVYQIETKNKIYFTEHKTIDANSQRLRVLLVEDNIINQKVAVHTIKKNGHKIDIAHDGIEAIDKFNTNKYDLILMDIQMPNMNGYEATKAIRKIEQDKQIAPIKIIAMTANALKGEKEKCIEIGMNDYLSKPFKQEMLIKFLTN